jgi:hypothetical protein
MQAQKLYDELNEEELHEEQAHNTDSEEVRGFQEQAHHPNSEEVRWSVHNELLLEPDFLSQRSCARRSCT